MDVIDAVSTANVVNALRVIAFSVVVVIIIVIIVVAVFFFSLVFVVFVFIMAPTFLIHFLFFLSCRIDHETGERQPWEQGSDHRTLCRGSGPVCDKSEFIDKPKGRNGARFVAGRVSRDECNGCGGWSWFQDSLGWGTRGAEVEPFAKSLCIYCTL